MRYFGKWNDLDFFLHSLSNILIRYNRKSRRCWPTCWTQSDINQSLHEAPALHFWRYDIIKYPLLPFYLLTSAPKGRRAFQSVCECRKLTDIWLDRWGKRLESVCDSPITMVTSLISITPSLTLIRSPPFCHCVLHLVPAPTGGRAAEMCHLSEPSLSLTPSN